MSIFRLLLTYLLLIIGVTISAQTEEDTTITRTKEFDQTFIRLSKVYWDAHLRVGHELRNNQEDLNDDLDDLYSFTRIKSFIGGGIRLNKKVKFYTRLINESAFMVTKELEILSR